MEMARGITTVILYTNGLVVCKDAAGRQSISLQGAYEDVIDKILKNVDDTVKWIYNEQEVSLGEWRKLGENATQSIKS